MGEHQPDQDDQLVKEERATFSKLIEDFGVDHANKEMKNRRQANYTQFIKPVKTTDTMAKLAWEDQLDKLGFKVIRNEQPFEGDGFAFYRGDYKNKPCLCKVYTSRDFLKRFNINNPERIAGIMSALNYPRIQKLIAAFEVSNANKFYYFLEPVATTLNGWSLTDSIND